MTRLMDHKFDLGYVADTFTFRMAWRFRTGRTDFAEYFREDVGEIIVNQLDQLGVPITQHSTIPHTMD